MHHDEAGRCQSSRNDILHTHGEVAGCLVFSVKIPRVKSQSGRIRGRPEGSEKKLSDAFMGDFFDGLLPFDPDLLGALPAANQLLEGYILVTCRDLLDLGLPQARAEDPHVIEISMKRLVPGGADIHRLQALRIKTSRNLLGPNLLAVEVDCHLTAIEATSNVVPFSVTKNLWLHRSTKFDIAPPDTCSHPDAPRSICATHGQQLAFPRILASHNGLPLLGRLRRPDPRTECQPGTAGHHRLIDHDGAKPHGQGILGGILKQVIPSLAVFIKIISIHYRAAKLEKGLHQHGCHAEMIPPVIESVLRRRILGKSHYPQQPILQQLL